MKIPSKNQNIYLKLSIARGLINCYNEERVTSITKVENYYLFVGKG